MHEKNQKVTPSRFAVRLSFNRNQNLVWEIFHNPTASFRVVFGLFGEKNKNQMRKKQ
jgi:hypothetical protein